MSWEVASLELFSGNGTAASVIGEHTYTGNRTKQKYDHVACSTKTCVRYSFIIERGFEPPGSLLEGRNDLGDFVLRAAMPFDTPELP